METISTFQSTVSAFFLYGPAELFQDSYSVFFKRGAGGTYCGAFVSDLSAKAIVLWSQHLLD